MKIKKWLIKNTSSLAGKRVAITGSTGGIGRELCRYLLMLDASLVLIDRNSEKQKVLSRDLITEFPSADITMLTADLEDVDSVKRVTDELLDITCDVFIHNAGAYSIPRRTTKLGFDNVFTINFISPYYMIRKLLPMLSDRCGRVVVVGSIAHNYSHTDKNDIDFKRRGRASLVYGNAKRYLMFSLYSLFENSNVALAVTHPGITFTGITAHYPKLIFAFIKYPMKIIFMKPRRAALSVLQGMFDSTELNEWIGPRLFNVWGLPAKKKLSTVDADEREWISKSSEDIYRNM